MERARRPILRRVMAWCCEELPAKNLDYQTVEYTATVKPGEKTDLLYEVIQHQDRNAKQNNVVVERSE